MIKIGTNGKDFIAGGVVYRPDKDGFVSIPKDIAVLDGIENPDKPKTVKRVGKEKEANITTVG